jgi:polysaccharide pyruvyl transferase WcaK-like protein
MDASGQRAVRMIHERCAFGSVRDLVSLEFVRGLGIRNVELTGCPVLFHGLQEPRFSSQSSDRLVLSVRARLLHVEEHWSEKQTATLRRLCREFRPALLLQSPYDVPLATRLAKEFGLECLQDSAWGATPMIDGVTRATRTTGFRLHFGMLSLAHGKPSTFLATDTRTTGFCDMVGVPWHAVQTYRDEDLLAELAGPQPNQDRFLVNWRSLRGAMASVLEANGITHALAPLPSPMPR